MLLKIIESKLNDFAQKPETNKSIMKIVVNPLVEVQELSLANQKVTKIEFQNAHSHLKLNLLGKKSID